MDLGAMALKGYCTFPKASALLEPHHRWWGEVLALFRKAVGLFYSPSWLGNFPNGYCLKVNTLARLEVEFSYNDGTVRHLSHYATGTSSPPWMLFMRIYGTLEHHSFVISSSKTCGWFDTNLNQNIPSSVGWGCRIHRLDLCREVKPSPNECPYCISADR